MINYQQQARLQNAIKPGDAFHDTLRICFIYRLLGYLGASFIVKDNIIGDGLSERRHSQAVQRHHFA
jgi:hypothetical protein